MITLLFLVFALVFYYLIALKTKDFFHPLAIGILLWFFTAGISNINIFYDANLQKTISIETNFVIFLSGLFFIFPTLFSYKLDKIEFKKNAIYFNLNYKIFFNILVCLCFFSFLLRFNTVLFNPPFFYVDDNVFDLKSAIPPALPIINIFDILTPFLAVLCLFEIFFSQDLSESRKRFLYIFIAFSIVASIFYKVSRGELIIFILAFIYLYYISREINVNLKKIMVVITLASSFIYLGVSRIPSESRVSTQFGDGFINIVFSQLYTYVAMNFQNLNMLVNSNYQPTYFWGGLKFILYPFFKSEYDRNTVGLTDYNTEFFNAKTYIYYFFNDFGLAGVLFYSLIIGLIVQYFYNLSTKNIKFFAFIACLLKAIIFMFFGNYFFGDNIIFLPYLIVLFLILMMKTIPSSKY